MIKRKPLLIKQDSFPVKVILLKDNPFGKYIVLNNIKLSTNEPITIYTQYDLNKFEPILKYIDIITMIEEDETINYDEINDDMNSFSDSTEI